MLLEMAFIQTPKIKVIPSHPLAEFFYMPVVLPGFLLQSLHGAYVAGIPTDEKGVDIVWSQSSNQTSDLDGETIRPHPIVPEDTQGHPEAFVNPLLLASVGLDSARDAVPSPLHPITPSILPPETDGTSTGWYEESVLINCPPHSYSSRGKEKAIHEVDGHIETRGIWIFPVAEPLSRSRSHQRLAFPWYPPFSDTMVTQSHIIRN
jgi:hypothetical protein